MPNCNKCVVPRVGRWSHWWIRRDGYYNNATFDHPINEWMICVVEEEEEEWSNHGGTIIISIIIPLRNLIEYVRERSRPLKYPHRRHFGPHHHYHHPPQQSTVVCPILQRTCRRRFRVRYPTWRICMITYYKSINYYETNHQRNETICWMTRRWTVAPLRWSVR